MTIRDRTKDAEALQPNRAQLKERSDRLISQAIVDLSLHSDSPMPSQKEICERIKVLDSTERGGAGVGLHPSTISRSPLVQALLPRRSSVRLTADYLNVNLNNLRANRDLIRLVGRLHEVGKETLIQRVVALEEELINVREQLQAAVIENFEHREAAIKARLEADHRELLAEEAAKKSKGKQSTSDSAVA